MAAGEALGTTDAKDAGPAGSGVKRNAILGLLLPPLLGLALAACGGSRLSAGSDGAPPVGRPVAADPPVLLTRRTVCSLINDDALSASITGFDGVTSVVAGGRDYWLFGDSFLAVPSGEPAVVPASFAISSDLDASDCVRMTYQRAAGKVVPLFPRLGENTAWPDGAIALTPDEITFYIDKVHRDSPFSWNVSDVGLGRLDVNQAQGTRVAESLWNQGSGFADTVVGARSPVRIGDDVYVFLYTSAGRNLLVRVPSSRMADASAYSYWTGSDWSSAPADAASLWPPVESDLPTDNGASVRYNEFLGKWLALRSMGLSTLQAQTADRLEGPWSDPYLWLRCDQAQGVQAVIPTCYSGEQHQELTRDGGRTLYVTFSSQSPFSVWLLEVRLAVGIHEWRRGAEVEYSAREPDGGGFEDGGVGFYAGDTPVPGFVPVYLWTKGQDRQYAPASPGDGFEQGGIVFYAAPAARVNKSDLTYTPVYRWDGPAAEHLYSPTPPAGGGFSQGPVSFFVPVR